MIDPTVLDAMVASGCTAEQIAAVVKAALSAGDAQKAAKREGNAERQRRFRERNANNALLDVTGVSNGDTPSPKKETSPTPPKEKTTPSHSPSSASAFAQFWAIYPNRVGKRDAESAFSRALTRSDLPTILAGLRRYAAKTDDRPWCNPATWLNQGRWDDEPAASTPQQRGGAPPAETVGSLSKRQLFEKRQFPDAPDDPTGRVVQIDARRLDESPGSARTFAFTGDILGRF